ncbi:hypothetical protein LXL04_039573 [Taraxacum kok-saghyz]
MGWVVKETPSVVLEVGLVRWGTLWLDSPRSYDIVWNTASEAPTVRRTLTPSLALAQFDACPSLDSRSHSPVTNFGLHFCSARLWNLRFRWACDRCLAFGIDNFDMMFSINHYKSYGYGYYVVRCWRMAIMIKVNNKRYANGVSRKFHKCQNKPDIMLITWAFGGGGFAFPGILG